MGDVILYTYIDGVYHISFPETATESIAKRGIDYKKNTINCGDNTYTWSGIDRLAARYYQEITEVEVETSYTLFLDPLCPALSPCSSRSTALHFPSEKSRPPRDI